MPPSSGSRSTMSTSSTPLSRAEMAAARPAGPPPLITMSCFRLTPPHGSFPAQFGILCRFCGWRSNQAQLLAEQVHHPGGAEPRLAPAHAGRVRRLTPSRGLGPQNAVDGVPDFPVGHLLAPADDLPVGRVLLDEGPPAPPQAGPSHGARPGGWGRSPGFPAGPASPQ